MSYYETEQMVSPSATVLSSCPQCEADLAVLRVIPGKSGSEYWTMRCIRCGGIHLNIVRPSCPPLAAEQPPESSVSIESKRDSRFLI
jgi:uncharacterized Zn finger protein